MTELILQCFQSAEVVDLPAVLRFLLQQLNANNASQVGLLQNCFAAPRTGYVLALPSKVKRT